MTNFNHLGRKRVAFVLLAGALLHAGVTSARTVVVIEAQLAGDGASQFDAAVSGDDLVLTDTCGGNQVILTIGCKWMDFRMDPS